jgi:hypothetical protein
MSRTFTDLRKTMPGLRPCLFGRRGRLTVQLGRNLVQLPSHYFVSLSSLLYRYAVCLALRRFHLIALRLPALHLTVSIPDVIAKKSHQPAVLVARQHVNDTGGEFESGSSNDLGGRSRARSECHEGCVNVFPSAMQEIQKDAHGGLAFKVGI